MLTIIYDEKPWQAILDTIGTYDCYHTHNYHKITKEHGGTEFLLNYEDDDIHIAIPFIKRTIEGTPYFDLTSTYGYAGPLIKTNSINPDFNKFQEVFRRFLEKEQIVTVFSRLHPYFPDQASVIQGLGEVIELGPIVNIDLSKDVELQRAAFSKTTKRYLNKTRRLFYVDHNKSESDILKFRELYNQTMNRLDAKDTYFFSMDYFLGFMNSANFQTDFMFAKTRDSDEVAAAAMILKTKNIVQYHLSGTSEKHMQNSPLRLLLDEARIQATKEQYRHFNLGGGVGSKQDSLFQFKSSFSKDFKVFKIWKYVVNKSVYEQLSKNTRLDKEIQNESFFPLYRANEYRKNAY